MNEKNTGIIRKLDNLGRVVIPAEIRRSQGLVENQPMEIIINDGMICFKKYIADNDFCGMIMDLMQVISNRAENPKLVNHVNIKLKEAADMVRYFAGKEEQE